MMRREFNYYMGLYDLKSCVASGETQINDYKRVNERDSGIDFHILLFEKNLKDRKNWIKISEPLANQTEKIDFCYTNLAKLQTKSTIHNRILLDTDHFISNKRFYYEKFNGYKFCPVSQPLIVDDLTNKLFENEPIVLKPDSGSLSFGVKILKKWNSEEILKHINSNKFFSDWSISRLYVPRLFNGYVVSNRIFFLIRKIRKFDTLMIDGFWYDEFVNYMASMKYNNIEKINEDNILDKIFVTNRDDEDNTVKYLKYRTVNHRDYMKIFTKKEYDIIKKKITAYLKIITKKIACHSIASNDYTPNYEDPENKNMTFHLYGVDSFIMDNLDIKFLEINGAPSLEGYENYKNNKYGDKFINYYYLTNKICEITIDVMFPPKNMASFNGNNVGVEHDEKGNILFERKFIKCGGFVKKIRKPIYFAKEIKEKYPFIIDGFFNEKRKRIFQRIKNPHSNDIYLFYGRRDYYIRDLSSYNYYDEILEWNKSKNSRNAKILNKIQGVTYYLASKDKLYENLSNCDFLPKGIIYELEEDTLALKNFISQSIKNKFNKSFIIKPVFGSKGKGINVIEKNFSVDIFVNKMKNARRVYGYTKFIVSLYISNPKLYNRRKFNLRFYVLLNVRKLPTHSKKISDVNYYILKDSQVYFTILPYKTAISNVIQEMLAICPENDKNVTQKLSVLNESDIRKMIHITNLQIVKNIGEKTNIDLKLDNFVNTLNNLEYDQKFLGNIWTQVENIINKSLSAVKSNLRPLNRFVNESSAFNLLAYDTMLDDNNKLHLIEINRGPDLHGLQISLGNDKITKIFSEMFDIVVDGKNSEFIYFNKYNLLY